jgi:hypothetical protein
MLAVLIAWLCGLARWAQSYPHALRMPPRLTPGIRADVIIVLGDDGTCGIFPSKLPEEEDVGEVYRAMTVHWLGFLQRAGISPLPPD